MPAIRAIIADCDPAARTQLRLLLGLETGVEVLAECTDGSETIAAIRAHKPDLLFLDIHLSDGDGFQVLDRMAPQDKPLVIFTSTHDQHAIRAFEARALDYLVKPFDERRVHAAIERTRVEVLRAHDRHLTHRLLDWLAANQSEAKADKRLVVKAGGRVVFLNADEIDWIEAAGNYVKIRAGEESYLLREGIGRLAERLDPAQFVRVHRSIIVNAGKIKELHPCNSGEYMVVLRDGKELSCSRGYRAKLQELIAKT